MAHYFELDENLGHRFVDIDFEVGGKTFRLTGDRGVFSKDRPDEGTLLLLRTIHEMDLGKRLLDLGCGLGPIGLILAALDPVLTVTCSDVNSRALELTRLNAVRLGVGERIETVESDLFANITSTYDAIVSNPPIRAGKRVTYALYEQALDHLNEGGHLYIVIRRKQGADSALAHIREIYREAHVLVRKKGYYVISAAK